jgi:hypothetical protein
MTKSDIATIKSLLNHKKENNLSEIDFIKTAEQLNAFINLKFNHSFELPNHETLRTEGDLKQFEQKEKAPSKKDSKSSCKFYLDTNSSEFKGPAIALYQEQGGATKTEWNSKFINQTFVQNVKAGDKKVIQMIISSPAYRTLAPSSLGKAAIFAALKGHDSILRDILSSKRAHEIKEKKLLFTFIEIALN